MSYQDALEVIEALGYDPVFGQREWVDGGLHVDDLGALALGLYQAQTSPIAWDHDRVAGDPFGDLFQSYAEELLIEPATRGEVVEISPPFTSWSLDASYTARKLAQVFNSVVGTAHRHRVAKVTDRRDEFGEFFVTLSHITLARIPGKITYDSHQHARGDLLRYAVEATNTFIVSSVYQYGGSTRELYLGVIAAIDAIWGIESMFD